MSIEAMKQALDALGYVMSHGAQVQIAKDILTQAIEQAEQQEPVAWMYVNRDGECEQIEYGPVPDDPGVTPLYTAPVDAVNTSKERVDETAERKHMTDLASVGEVGVWGEREWVGLTDEEVSDVIDNVLEGGGWLDVARALEAAIKRKNT
jgi:hypothetical protein